MKCPKCGLEIEIINGEEAHRMEGCGESEDEIEYFKGCPTNQEPKTEIEEER